MISQGHDFETMKNYSLPQLHLFIHLANERLDPGELDKDGNPKPKNPSGAESYRAKLIAKGQLKGNKKV